MKLIVVESPNKAKTMSAFLPEGFNIIASLGHIMEIPSKGLNVDIENGTFVAVNEIISGKEEIVNTIKSQAEKADEVFIATDCDAEGERIALDIACFIEDKRKIKRAEFHEITKKAVLKAISNPREIDLNKVNSQVARRVLDRLIGYLVSPILWNKVPGGKSAGRVQSVALRLIAEREFEIEAFKAEKFWDVNVALKFGKETVTGVVKTKDKNRFLKEDEAKKAKEIVSKSSPVVSDVEKKKTSRTPQPPFDTGDMQEAASAMLGWPSPKTMEVAQKLFEGGFTTYHRTDSYTISDEALKGCREWIKGKFGDKYLPNQPRTFEQKTKSQEAHECIRPTSLTGEGWSLNDLSEDEKKLLNMIKARFIASQMENMDVEKTNITVSCSDYDVLVEGKSILFDGWSNIWKVDSKEVFLPSIAEGDKPNLVEAKVKLHETRPPERYNDGSLVKKMKKEGVGRPSTWATLVENLVARNYVTKDGKNFVLTQIGREVAVFLIKDFDNFFMDIGFTSKVEEELDRISRGEVNKLDVIKSFYESLDKIVNKEKHQAWAEIFS